MHHPLHCCALIVIIHPPLHCCAFNLIIPLVTCFIIPQVDSITIPVGPRLGDKVVEVSHLSKGFGDRLLLDDATFSVPPGGG